MWLKPHSVDAFWPLEGGAEPAPPWAFDEVRTTDHDGGSMHPEQVRTILERSADDLGKPGNDHFYGAGRVNALRAVLD